MNAPQSRAQKNLRFALRVAALFAKAIGAAASLLVVAAIAAYFALPYVVDAQRVRGMLEAQLQQILHRPVRIQNVIVTPQGVKLDRFRVLSQDGSWTFIEGDFALVTVKLRALLDKRLELSNVRLAGPRIRVERDASGRWSFEDIFASTEAARQGSAKPFGLPVTLAADRTEIESGRLEVDDKLRGRHFVIDRFNLGVKEFDFEAPFLYSASFDYTATLGARNINASISLNGQAALAGFDWAQAWLKADRAVIKVGAHAARGSFAARGLPFAAVEADVRLPELGPKDWQELLERPLDLALPPSHWKVKTRWLEPGKVRVEWLAAKAGSFAAQADGIVDVSRGQPEITADVAMEDFPLAQAAGYRAALADYALRGTARGEASVKGWPGRWTVAKAHVRLSDVEARFKSWQVLKGAADVAASDDFAKLAVALSSGAVKAYGSDFSDITASLSIARKNLSLDYLSLRWEGSKLRLRGKVANLPDPTDVWVSGSIDRVRWERAQELVTAAVLSASTQTARAPQPADEDSEPKRLWVQTFKYAIPKRFPNTIGHVRIGKVVHKNFSFGDMDLLWDLRGVTPKLDTVDGELRVASGPGRVDDIQAVQDSHKFLRIVFLPYIFMHKMNSLSVLSAATAYPKTLDFSRIEGQYGVHRGVVTTRFSDVDSPQLVAYADGTADFGKESVDMSIMTRLTSYRAPLPEWWVDELGRPAIGFRVKGDLNRPDLEPRLHKIGAHEIEDTLDDARKRAKVRFEAMAKLQQLEGKPAAPAPKPGPSVAEQDIKKGAKKPQ